MTPAEFQALRKKANIAQHGLGYTCWEGQLERFAALVRNATIEEVASLGRVGDRVRNPALVEFVGEIYELRNLKDKT